MLNEQQREIRQEGAAANPEDESSRPETELETVSPSPFQKFRALLDQARRTQQPLSRRELSRDKSKSLLLLVGVSIALLLVFFGVFSTPKTRTTLPGDSVHGTSTLGRRVTPGQEKNDPAKAVTPLLSADVRDANSTSGSEVTPEEVGGTSPHYDQFRESGAANLLSVEKPTSPKVHSEDQYALRNVDFSDPVQPQGANSASAASPSGEPASDLKKPSLVFVRATQAMSPLFQSSPREENAITDFLPAGTRLIARLEAPVSSAVSAPAIAVVEYSYERNGEIVLPAGTKVLGTLSHVSPAGLVGFQFDRVELPDGTKEKIDATAMDLKFGPLKGTVSGRSRGRNFFIRSMTGLGTAAAYVVGGPGATGFNGPISENSLMRERLAENIGTAGQEELNSLGFNRNVVVTVPGNTRFYIVIEKEIPDSQMVRPAVRSVDTKGSPLSAGTVPTLEELRELMQLKNELNQMYLQTATQAPPAQQ